MATKLGRIKPFVLNITKLKQITHLLRRNNFLSTEWISLGIELGIYLPTLKAIEAKYGPDVDHCLRECLTKWLTKSDSAEPPTYQTLVKALREIKQNVVADNIDKTMTAPASQLLQHYSDRLSQVILTKRTVQLLHTEGVITEETATELEQSYCCVLKGDLLISLYTAVSKDHKKCKIFASILLKTEEAVPLGTKINDAYDDVLLVFQPAVVHEEHNDFTSIDMNPELVRKRYSLGHLLHTLAPLIKAKIPSLDDFKTFLRRCQPAFRVRLEKARAFDDVMELLEEDCSIENIVALEETVDHYNVETAHVHICAYKGKLKNFNATSLHSTTFSAKSTSFTEGASAGTADTNSVQTLSLQQGATEQMFERMRYHFGKFIHTIAPLIRSGIPSLDSLKTFIRRCRPDVKQQIKLARTFDSLFKIVERMCSIVDIFILENIVDQFNIEQAKAHISAYKTKINEFCSEKNSLSICNNIHLKNFTEFQLLYETIKFTVDWNIQERTYNDVKNYLNKAFGKMAFRVEVVKASNDRSITVTCYAPHYLMESLLVIARGNLDLLKKEGLISLTIGYYTLYDQRAIEEELNPIKKQAKELEENLQMYRRINNAMSSEIKQLKSSLNSKAVEMSKEVKDKDEKIVLLQGELHSKEGIDQTMSTMSELISKNQLTNLESIQLFQFAMSDCNDVNMPSKVAYICRNSLLHIDEKSSSFLKAIEEDDFLLAELRSLKEGGNKIGWVRPIEKALLLYSPSASKCEEIVSELKENRQPTIRLGGSSTEIVTLLLPPFLKGKTVKEVFISYTPLSEASIQSLSLSTNTSLKTLSLSCCMMTDQKLATLSKSLKGNNTLTSLNLSYNTAIENAKVIKDLMTDTALTEININGTSITDEGVQMLLEILSTEKKIRQLTLSNKYESVCKSFKGFEDFKNRLCFV